MLLIDKPWKKHIIICVIISIISLVIFFHEIITISLNLFIISIFFFISALYFVGWIFYRAFFKSIKRLYQEFTELNNHGYSQYGLLRNNLFITLINSFYLMVFYTYFITLVESNLYKFLLGWLPVFIIRISHYADYETGYKIGKAITNYIFPIWLILIAYHISNLSNDFFSIINKNLSVIYYFISVVAVTYTFEIIMSRKTENIISNYNTNNINNKENILAKYSEILYSSD